MDAERRVRIAQLLDTGALPYDLPETAWAYRCRSATPCAGCGTSIDTGRLEVDAWFRLRSRIHMHWRCAEAWLQQVEEARHQ